MFYDTHAHFGFSDEEPASNILQRALTAGVKRVLAVGGSVKGNQAALALAKLYPAHVCAALAFDRDQQPLDSEVGELELLLTRPEVAAVGETGLDFHYGRREDSSQRVLFRRMLALARKFTLPVIVHSRSAEQEILADLNEHVSAWKGKADRIGVMHCFTGGLEYAQRLLELGFYISFSGIVTFKNSHALREVAASIPADRLVAETDTPFLAPEPLRGRRNEPQYLPLVLKVIAQTRGQTLEEMAAVTKSNALRLFHPESEFSSMV